MTRTLSLSSTSCCICCSSEQCALLLHGCSGSCHLQGGTRKSPHRCAACLEVSAWGCWGLSTQANGAEAAAAAAVSSGSSSAKARHKCWKVAYHLCSTCWKPALMCCSAEFMSSACSAALARMRHDCGDGSIVMFLLVWR